MWKAIRAGGKDTYIECDLPIGGRNKLTKCINYLNNVRQELKDAQGGMAGHCLRARRHVEAAIEQLEKARSYAKNR